MELKKSKKADLKRFKGLFLNIGYTISIVVTILAFEWKDYDRADLMVLGQVEEHMEEIVELPITKQPPPPAPILKKVNIIEIPDEEMIEEVIEITLDIEIVEETIIEEMIYEEPVMEEAIEEAFTIVEQNPKFIGGDYAFAVFIRSHLKYPDQARRMGAEGRVFVHFIVEKDGSLSNIGILRGIGAGCDKEAVRVMHESPLWEPGKQRGRPVRVHMVIPLTFRFD